MQEVIKDLYHGLEKHTGKRSAQFILHPLKDPLSWKTFKGAIESIPEYRRSPVLALTLLGFFSSNHLIFQVSPLLTAFSNGLSLS